MNALKTLRRTVATVAVLALMAPAAEAQASGSGCQTGLFITCATWSISRTGATYTVTVTNDGPARQRFMTIGVIGVDDVTNFTSSSPVYTLGNNDFNGALWMGGVLQPQSALQPRADWSISGNNALPFESTGTFTFEVAGNPEITQLYVHAIAGPNDASQWIVLENNVVPEPSTYALMATGLAGLAGVARRRRSA